MGTLVLATAVQTPTSAQAVETCQGKPATVVATGPGLIQGTDGPDVIVAGAGGVDAGSGDDLICLVGAPEYAFADAGPGNDVVDATAAENFFVLLGEGADTYLGGTGRDTVNGGGWEHSVDGIPPALDTEPDVISTGGGDDSVNSGLRGSANLDTIVTGSGDDIIFMAEVVPHGHLDVGGGRNSIFWELGGSATWRFNATHRTIHYDQGSSSWSGHVLNWNLSPTAEEGSVVRLAFVGSSSEENVAAFGHGLDTAFHLRGGDDRAVVQGDTLRGNFALGPGQDELVVNGSASLGTVTGGRLFIDLESHEVDFGADGVESRISGVEALEADADWLRILGSDRAERIDADGCDVELRGGGGPDLLARHAADTGDCGGLTRGRVFGGPGADRLRGAGSTDDLLVGGTGLDYANGRGGTDTCRAETTKNCEKK